MRNFHTSNALTIISQGGKKFEWFLVFDGIFWSDKILWCNGPQGAMSHCCKLRIYQKRKQIKRKFKRDKNSQKKTVQ